MDAAVLVQGHVSTFVADLYVRHISLVFFSVFLFVFISGYIFAACNRWVRMRCNVVTRTYLSS